MTARRGQPLAWKRIRLRALPILLAIPILLTVGCRPLANGPMVISNQGEQTVQIRVVGPSGTKEDFEVRRGTRRDLVTTVQFVQMLVAFDDACSELMVIDFDVEDLPFSAGGVVMFEVGHFAEFEPGAQASSGIDAEPGRHCAKTPTPELVP